MITLVAVISVLCFGILGSGLLFWMFMSGRIPKDEGINYCFGVVIAFCLLMMCVALVGMAEKQYYYNLMH